MLRCVMSCHVMSCYVMLCYAIPYHTIPYKSYTVVVLIIRYIMLSYVMFVVHDMLESAPQSIFTGGSRNLDQVESLNDLTSMFLFSAHDPRILAIFIEIQPIACGYAKLIELKRAMNYFRQSGKKVYGFSEVASEKEVFLALGCDFFFVPPDGGLDLRGFAGGATFFRGIFDKVGIEPQVQRIGRLVY